MREKPYTGPTDTNDFDHLTPDEAARQLNQYRLLGDCFELSDDEDMFGRGYLIEDWKTLLGNKKAAADRAQRELAAAVQLSRTRFAAWGEIGEIVGMTWLDASRVYGP